jgi:hypothetical protein
MAAACGFTVAVNSSDCQISPVRSSQKWQFAKLLFVTGKPLRTWGSSRSRALSLTCHLLPWRLFNKCNQRKRRKDFALGIPLQRMPVPAVCFNSPITDVTVVTVKWLLGRLIFTLFELQTSSVALVRERTIPTQRPPVVGEVGANFFG